MQIEKFGLHHFLSELLDCPVSLFKEKMVSLWLSLSCSGFSSPWILFCCLFSLTGTVWRLRLLVTVD